MRANFMRSSIVAGALLISVQGIASAHVTVYPKQFVAGAYENFVLRVPSEKEIPTTKVKVEIPAGFTVSRVKPVSGWTYTFTKDASGKVTAIEWTGGEITATEYQEFGMSGKAPAEAGKVAWKAYQTYKDGTVVEWTGPSDAKTPASVVEVVAGTGTADAHGDVHDAKPAATEAAKEEAHGVTGWAAWGGLGLGALALLVALFKKK
ncbi:MAG TPA: YcnI family protein [Symbiobacteriaceae bacterium]|nr:YcnI family protein [Symbiobacteriaceae bacterium]